MDGERGKTAMLIHVEYRDSRYDYVKEDLLDELIETREITRFRRTSGWVTLGVDPIRRGRREYKATWSEELRRMVS